jgi:hypothetical protein
MRRRRAKDEIVASGDGPQVLGRARSLPARPVLGRVAPPTTL